MRPVGATVLALGLALGGVAYADVPLPKPVGTIPVIRSAFVDRPERIQVSQLPGPVADTERVDVLVDPSGVPAAVTMTQTLELSGTGQFVVRERSSAQDVEALDDTVTPVLKREAVIWQGFVSGSKTLRARLTLDPAIEAELLPFSVAVEWRGTGRIGQEGALPGPGQVVVRLLNRTARPAALPTGTAAANDLAGPLDALLSYATSRAATPPPMAGRGLPATLPGTAGPARQTTTVAPLRVTGTITAPGGTGDGPGTTATAGGVQVDGVLQGDAEFLLNVPAAGALRIDLTAVPTLDARLLRPPRGATWAAWLRLGPTAREVADAFTALVDGAAAAARTDEYAPYLGHHGPGPVRTTYHVALAPRALVRLGSEPLHPKPFGIVLALVALLGVLGNATALWRRL
jgi:hypothetical protein